MNQQVRLETKSGELIEMLSLPGEGNEPDAILKGLSVYIRRPMLQLEPPKKNSPEVYFEANSYQVPTKDITAPAFDKVTEAPAPVAVEERSSFRRPRITEARDE